MKEAMLWSAAGDNAVKCSLCSWRCTIPEGKRGFCGVRENRGGRLFSIVYGHASSYAVDKIEKKPFFHFHPNSLAFSFSTIGCNFRCLGCQNYEISQATFEQSYRMELPPERIVQLAKQNQCSGVAYTYTEPTVFFEYAHDTAALAKAQGLYNVFVTNGYMTPEAIEQMRGIDAARVDLKSFSDEFYKKICSARLEPVLESIKLLHKRMHVEIITLVIPKKNDGDDELRAIARWVAGLGKDIPLHFIRFWPMYELSDVPQTPVATLERARAIALEEGVRFAYVGNVPGHEGENTYCYECGTLLIKRHGFDVLEYKLTDKKACPECGAGINVVGEFVK
jgi:pyruvate formate lyase activating enzyme